jgi:hypothetical protein
MICPKRLLSWLVNVLPLGGMLAWVFLLASCDKPQVVVGQELLINGSFETPLAPPGKFPVGSAPPASGNNGSSDHIIPGITPGHEPPDFGWKVESGDVDIIAHGYDSGGGDVLLSKMADGHQCLDLDGFTPGTIAQTIPTVPGAIYVLTFAYANNTDFEPNSGHSHKAKISVVDDASKNDLVKALHISHDTSTLADLLWIRCEPIHFKARSDHTTIRFQSEDDPSSRWGIYLDDISVKAIAQPNE